MALSAAADITGLNHTLQQLITQLALYKLEIPGKYPKQRFQLFTLITGTQQHENARYRTIQKQSVICTTLSVLCAKATPSHTLVSGHI